MSLLLCSTEYREQLSPGELQLLVRDLPPAIQAKAMRYLKWEDKCGCIFGKFLLRLALRKMGFSDDLDKLQYSRENKPFLPGGPHFNISHSANRAICIVSAETRVGIDIENSMEEVRFDDFESQFTYSEWRAIRTASDPQEEFFRMWTSKESIMKADGRGLGIPLDKIDVSRLQPVFLDGNAWALTRLPQFQGYACHFCLEIPLGEARMVHRRGTAVSRDFSFYEILPTDFLSQGFDI